MRAFWAQAWPDPDEAQDLIEKELSDPRYQVPEPTWWDKFVAGIVDFLTDLVSSVASDAAGPYLVWIIASVLVVSVVQRSKEIGILRAMGASRGQILRTFLLQGGIVGLAQIAAHVIQHHRQNKNGKGQKAAIHQFGKLAVLIIARAAIGEEQPPG